MRESLDRFAAGESDDGKYQLMGVSRSVPSAFPLKDGAPEGIRTPNLLIRSQMLYPLSYERRFPQSMGSPSSVRMGRPPCAGGTFGPG